MAGLTYKYLQFADLNGWADDDHQAALRVFRVTADLMDGSAWGVIADVAKSATNARAFFEDRFTPVLIEDDQEMLFTGYYEPELNGSRKQSGDYQFPIYAVPADLDPETPYLTRRQIEQDKPLAGQRLELAWLSNPVDRFFLQVQGSGRIKLPHGDMIRVGFGAKNGHPYTSIGKVLIARGVMQPDGVSPAAIREWVDANGDEGRNLLWENESYVFFREVNEVPVAMGPIGAMNRSITAGRSIAIDPRCIPYGAPVWIEKHGMHRLTIAQDTGSAIKGAQRADIFIGTGDLAGQEAGQIKDSGRMVALMPKGWRHA
jgi:membrane-bound lytic murein transglycosylase A